MTGSGLTAALGTSPSGLAESPITKGMKMVMVRTVQPFPTTKPPVTKIGLTLHAMGWRGTLFAQDQYVKVKFSIVMFYKQIVKYFQSSRHNNERLQ